LGPVKLIDCHAPGQRGGGDYSPNTKGLSSGLRRIKRRIVRGNRKKGKRGTRTDRPIGELHWGKEDLKKGIRSKQQGDSTTQQ